MITLGRHSYTAEPINNPFHVKVHVGNFSSIAERCSVYGSSGQHPPVYNPLCVSSYPFTEKGWNGYSSCIGQGDIHIGSDVWIGAGVTLIDGITIGSGSIVGAGAVVAKDIEPYSIVVGNPAKVVKKRFSDDVVLKLLQMSWWTWTDDKIRAALPDMRNIEDFLKKYCQKPSEL